MKNFSLILNVILILAVGFLYFHVFSKNAGTTKSNTTSVKVSDGGSMVKTPIAYVELDSLNENISYIKQKRKELEGEQKAIESEWQQGIKGLENQRDNFIKRGNTITQEEAEQFQMKLMNQQQQIEEKKQNLTQKLSEKSYNFMEDIQKNLKQFLADYNKEKNYMYIFTSGTGLDYMVYKDSAYDITKDVVEGMNKRMNEKNQKK